MLLSNRNHLNLSYTQNLEDYHLSLAFDGQDTGFYIDIGAGHPVADSVSFWFYLRGWQGIVVEPQESLAALHRRIRPRDTVVCEVVGRSHGIANFYEVDPFHGLSTTIKVNASNASALGARYKKLQVPSTTVTELCERYNVKVIDFLKIDVEGAEADVLKGTNFDRFRPKIIVSEAVAPITGEPIWPTWERELLEQGYEFILFDSLNRFYVATEQRDIAARLPTERAPWGSAIHMYEIGRAPENIHHPDHAIARDLENGLWASLPELHPELIATLLLRGRLGYRPNADEAALLAHSLNTDAFRAALGRIACSYDGGQISPEKS